MGKYSTVGSLMGFIVGKSMFIEGLFAGLPEQLTVGRYHSLVVEPSSVAIG